MKQKIAVYAGSFDPVTYGHLDIIERASKIFNHLVVSIFTNKNKKAMFTLEERKDMLKKVLGKNKNVSIDCFDGLLVDYVKQKKVNVVIRGLRAISDLEYEFQIAGINRMLYKDIETVFFMPSAKYSHLSSSMVREIGKFKGDVSKLVPPYVAKSIKKKLF
ncbi:MAG: pantetheine-phosphate adenylyltransferase [Elusimicrobiales bacterium]|nr:pantetheine-phosphate adenylyltransferase [Elusimicrobiales bacterium]MCK5583085.1 pantetheine-phosphate adenylyltransferase [Elusimicrobiales bacterium]